MIHQVDKFKTEEPVNTLGHGRNIEGQDGMSARFQRIDRRVVKFRVHWFPMHMNINVVRQFFLFFICIMNSSTMEISGWKVEPLEETWYVQKTNMQISRTRRIYLIDQYL